MHVAVREQLKAALKSQDPALLSQAIAEYEERDVPEKNKDLQKAKNLMEYLVLSQG
jgi:hypothetical protein